MTTSIEGLGRLKFRISGRQLLMHNSRLANPLDPHSKGLKALTRKRNKTDDDLREIALAECRGGIYHSDELGPYIPDVNIQAALVEAGKITKQGKDVKRSIFIEDLEHPLQYKGPRGLDELIGNDTFMHFAIVTIGKAKTLRCRPIFTNWSLEFAVQFALDGLNREDVISIVNRAGLMVGIGDWRPRFGRFTAEVVE